MARLFARLGFQDQGRKGKCVLILDQRQIRFGFGADDIRKLGLAQLTADFSKLVRDDVSAVDDLLFGVNPLFQTLVVDVAHCPRAFAGLDQNFVFV